jgi:hypothetical protein
MHLPGWPGARRRSGPSGLVGPGGATWRP